MRIGVLTGGGDCPGLNAVIRAIVRKGHQLGGHEFVGFRYGWAGVLKNEATDLTLDSTRGILHRGGTILGSSRTNPYKVDGGADAVKATMDARGLDALIPIGGEDTLGVAGRLTADGVSVVGVPKTIDNDLAATDFTFGFQTAVQIATDAIDRLHTTAESHNRVIIVEVMGRHAGWIALYSGLAGGADVVLIPERPFDLEEVCQHIRRRHQAGRTFSIVVVAEGATPADGDLISEHQETDAFGHVRLGGIAVTLEKEIEARTGYESRMTILGHVQRGGTPLAFDRVLGTRFGVAAMAAAAEGDFGQMVALRGTRIERVPLAEALAEPKLVDPELYETAEVFFG
jgi:6-phosphofructokinase 1